jgi:hypothetical protein
VEKTYVQVYRIFGGKWLLGVPKYQEYTTILLRNSFAYPDTKLAWFFPKHVSVIMLHALEVW